MVPFLFIILLYFLGELKDIQGEIQHHQKAKKMTISYSESRCNNFSLHNTSKIGDKPHR